MKRTRYGPRIREYLVRWKGDYPSDWMSEDALNCGSLIFEFEQRRKARDRMEAVDAEEAERSDL